MISAVHSSPASFPSISRAAEPIAAQVASRAVGPDVLRSLAILLVVLVHLPLEATPAGLVTVRDYGWLGVDIFFVLSGFLIGTQLFRELSQTGTVGFRSFYLRRAFRIFPAFFVVLALYAFLPVLRESAAMQPIWRFATFTVNLGLDPRTGNAFSQAWTLSVEEQFYVALPLLVLLFHRRLGLKSGLAAVAGLTIAGMLLRYSLWDSQVGTLVAEGKVRDAFAVYLRDVYYPTYARLDGLVFGVALAAARLFRPDLCERFLAPRVALPLGSLLVMLAIFLFSLRGPLEGSGTFLVFQALPGSVAGFPLISLGIALLLGVMLDWQHVLGRFRLPGIATVATLSYSLYLTHKSVFHIDRLIFGKDLLQGGFGFLVYLVTSFAVAALLWFCVERTFLLLRDRFVSRT